VDQGEDARGFAGVDDGIRCCLYAQPKCPGRPGKKSSGLDAVVATRNRFAFVQCCVRQHLPVPGRHVSNPGVRNAFAASSRAEECDLHASRTRFASTLERISSNKRSKSEQRWPATGDLSRLRWLCPNVGPYAWKDSTLHVRSSSHRQHLQPRLCSPGEKLSPAPTRPLLVNLELEIEESRQIDVRGRGVDTELGGCVRRWGAADNRSRSAASSATASVGLEVCSRRRGESWELSFESCASAEERRVVAGYEYAALIRLWRCSARFKITTDRSGSA
jgi:hypothetical protein